MHDYWQSALIIIVILIGILLNKRDLDRMEDRLEKRIDRLELRIDAIIAQLADHDARLRVLEKKS